MTTEAQLRAVRPALTPKQRHRAMIAGGVGFSLLTVGRDILLVLAGFLVLGAFLSGFAGLFTDSGRDTSDQIFGLMFGLVIIPLAIGGIVALLVLAAGLLTSWLVLRRTGQRAAAITWAGFGVSIIPSALITLLLAIAASSFNNVSTTLDSSTSSDIATFAVIVAAFVDLLLSVAVGAFAWLWMAHLLRPRADAASILAVS